MEELPRRRSGRWSFSVRSLAAVIVLIALFLGFIARPWRERRDAITYIEEQGGFIAFGYQFRDGSYDSYDSRASAPSIWQPDDLFRRWMHADIVHVSLSNVQRGSKVLKYVERLDSVQDLALRGYEFTDEVITPLAGLQRLERVGFYDTSLTDGGLKTLSRLPRLRSIDLENAPVSDAGLAALVNLTHLEFLGVRGTNVTAAGRQWISERIPGLKIEFGPRRRVHP
jgi:hypothetical protein